SRSIAVARTIDGVELRAMRSSRSFSPSGFPSRAALMAGPQGGSRLGRSPYHFLIASAAHWAVSFGFVWHLLQAFDVPSSTDKSGRGKRKLWSRRSSITMYIREAMWQLMHFAP